MLESLPLIGVWSVTCLKRALGLLSAFVLGANAAYAAGYSDCRKSMFLNHPEANQFIQAIKDDDLSKVKGLVDKGFPKHGGCWIWHIASTRALVPPVYAPLDELTIAMTESSWEMIEYFLEPANGDAKKRQDQLQDGLRIALPMGKIEYAKNYVALGGNVAKALRGNFFPSSSHSNAAYMLRLDEYCDFLFAQPIDWNEPEPVSGNQLSSLLFSMHRSTVSFDHCLRGILKKGADINRLDSSGMTPLHDAIAGVLDQHLEERDDISNSPPTMEIMNSPVLWHAYVRKNIPELEVVFILLEGNADPNRPNADGNTPLIYAASLGSISALRNGMLLNLNEVLADILLHRGARVDAKGKDGRTPLMAAVEGGYSNLVTTLIVKKADLNGATTDGRTPLAVAADRGDRDMAMQLFKSGAKLAPALAWANVNSARAARLLEQIQGK